MGSPRRGASGAGPGGPGGPGGPEGPGGIGDFGQDIPGPPWILGHRGVPREAPENTLASLRRALDLGLDGFEYDLRACATGEAVLIHDERLERTTDASGPLIARSLPELFGIDAGAWYSKRYAGEPLPLFDEALELAGDALGRPLHMIELKERGLVGEVQSKLDNLAPTLDLRVASFLRDVVLEARDAGLPSMLLGVGATEDDRRFVRDERLDAYSTGPGGWRTPAGAADWSFCERWSWSVDEPDDLLEACRTPLFGFNTNEPWRALATRALVHLAPEDRGPFPIQTPTLAVEPESLSQEVRIRGEWYGTWRTHATVRNPFPFAVEARVSLFVQSGAFDVDGLPQVVLLGPGEEAQLGFTLTGGARGPGDDPLVATQYRWKQQLAPQAARGGGRLLLTAPLKRVRILAADGLVRRLELLRERVDDPPASMNVRREGQQLLVSIENPGDLEEPHTLVHLAGEVLRGGRGLRLRLPQGFDADPGVAFSCGIEGKRRGAADLRRWAGGLPEGLGHGRPGVLVPLGAG